ncbi:MAG: hypothetical protein ACRCSK_07820, partial [Fusobacteriaceae bacterium]
DSDRKKIIFADELKNYKEFNFNEREKFLSYGKINSVRIVDYKKEVIGIFYPSGNSKKYLDVVDIKKKIAEFLASTKQEYGNWVSKESIEETLNQIPNYSKDFKIFDKLPDDTKNYEMISYDRFNNKLGKLGRNKTVIKIMVDGK